MEGERGKTRGGSVEEARGKTRNGSVEGERGKRRAEAWKGRAERRSVWRYGNFGGMRRTASGKQEEKIAGNGGKVI